MGVDQRQRHHEVDSYVDVTQQTQDQQIAAYLKRAIGVTPVPNKPDDLHNAIAVHQWLDQLIAGGVRVVPFPKEPPPSG